MTEHEQHQLLTLLNRQAQIILILTQMLQARPELLSEEDQKLISLSKSGAYNVLGDHLE